MGREGLLAVFCSSCCSLSPEKGRVKLISGLDVLWFVCFFSLCEGQWFFCFPSFPRTVAPNRVFHVWFLNVIVAASELVDFQSSRNRKVCPEVLGHNQGLLSSAVNCWTEQGELIAHCQRLLQQGHPKWRCPANAHSSPSHERQTLTSKEGWAVHPQWGRVSTWAWLTGQPVHLWQLSPSRPRSWGLALELCQLHHCSPEPSTRLCVHLLPTAWKHHHVFREKCKQGKEL